MKQTLSKFAVLGFLAFSLVSQASASADEANAVWNAVDFGAKATALETPVDEAFDSTEAIQTALNTAQAAGGGTVTLPSGRFTIKGTLLIPGGVTLEGTYRAAVTINTQNQPADGTILLAYAGRGEPESAPFIQLAGTNAVIKGVSVIYPEWNRNDVPPIPYPPCIESHDTNNVAVIDCCLLNPYEGIKFVRAARHLVRNVTGYPIWRGLFVDQCYDIGHIENIHYWPFGLVYNPKDPYCEWINLNAVAFELARTDWHYVANTFCFGYGVGYKFSDCGSGGTNGNFLGLGADSCRRAVLVEQAQAPGLLITNGEFVGRWRGEDSVCLEIGENCTGKVSLVNCSFWGPIDTCVQMNAAGGIFSASACHFVHWDNMNLDKPAIDLRAGKSNIANCTFAQSGTDVQISNHIRSVILTGNQASGGFRTAGITEKNAKRIEQAANEKNSVELEPEAFEHYRLAIGSNIDGAFVRAWYSPETMPQENGEKTFRWSGACSKLMLPVKSQTAYTASLELTIPAAAIGDEAGIYVNGEKKADLASGGRTISVPVESSDNPFVTMEIRANGWTPETGDNRVLGIQGFSVEMKAEGASDRCYQVDTDQWLD